ncbi:MAG: taurine catabolism dioxygenase [Porticoccaceae bacterium]|nr:MAG: taurine catabolism dioxygenase [Porticoccaceae bacterium]
MATISVFPLAESLPFGARVVGVDLAALEDEGLREELRTLFEERGLILFEVEEPSQALHVALSNVFGPLKEHPVPTVARVDPEHLPGVIDMVHDPATAGIWEVEGRVVSSWLPWHFDHCYNDELNRAGVLRAIDIPPEGGLTGFADGVQLYRDLDPALRERIAGQRVLYTLDMRYTHMRFGRPPAFREIRPMPGHLELLDYARSLPRAVHPAVWTRPDGTPVLHVSPWMAVGLEGAENPEGDALLEAVCQQIRTRAQAYWHRWRPGDFLIWDNWRFLHAVSGHPPEAPRRMQRTTIRGDYGLGYFECGARGHRLQAELEV